jgi:hypothetical protein
MAREERPEEQEAVRTTIVGGRPPGSGKPLGPIPRGIEVLVKKAAVDPEFKRLLVEKRGEAAKVIGLTLDPAEAMMLAAAPKAQLEAIITQTTVSPSVRSAFLGRAAAVMLAALGTGIAVSTAEGQVARAVKVDVPPPVVRPIAPTAQPVPPATAEAPAAPTPETAAVQARIVKEYLQAFGDLASKQNLTDRTVRINLSIDAKGEVESLQIGNPVDAGPVGFRDQLSGQIMKWTFPDSKEAMKMIVLLQTPRRAPGVSLTGGEIPMVVTGVTAVRPVAPVAMLPSQVIVIPEAPAVTKDEAAAMQARIVKEYAQGFADVAGRLGLVGKPIRFAVMLDGRGEAVWVRFMDLAMATPVDIKQLTDPVMKWKFADVKTLGEATVTIETVMGPAAGAPEEPKISVSAGGTIAVAPPLTAKPGPVTVEPGIVPAPFDEKAVVAPPEKGAEIERRVRLIAVGSVPAMPVGPLAK